MYMKLHIRHPIIRAGIIQLLNLAKASQAFAIIAPYYVMTGVVLGISALIIFGKPDPLLIIQAVTLYEYPSDDTSLIYYLYGLLTLAAYIITAATRAYNIQISKWNTTTLIRAHQKALIISFIVFVTILLPFENNNDIFGTLLIHTGLYLLLYGMAYYYFLITAFITSIQNAIRPNTEG